MAKRVTIGDIAEVPTAKGLAYIQVTHRNAQWGHLIRILPGFHPSRPSDLADIVQASERFTVFFPLGAALHRKIFEIVGNASVPEWSKPFPLFRSAGFIDGQGRVHDWWLWDGTKEWKVGKLDEQTRKLPILGVWNDTLLIERIEQEWTPATDARSQD